MIKSIFIKNFQSYKEAFIDFHSGFNVINGTTNEGKSVIVRALKWACFNAPQGFSFRSNFAKNESTEVHIFFPNGSWVKRIRNETENYYSCSTHDRLEALRGAVPDEIRKIIEIGEINIQGQFDKLFLLGESSPQIGRYLNDLLDLTIIDSSVKKINSINRETQGKIKNNSKEIEKIETEIKRLNWVLLFDEKLKKVEHLSTEIDTLITSLTSIELKNITLSSTKENIAKINRIVVLKDTVDFILSACSEIDSLDKKLKVICTQKESVSEKKKKLNELDVVMNKKEKINELLEIDKNIKKKENDYEKIKSRRIILGNMEKRIINLENQIGKDKKTYAKETRGNCPLCGK